MTDPIRKAGARFPLHDLDLVIWERDPKWPCVDHLYIILGDPEKPGEYPEKIIRRLAYPRACHQTRGSLNLGEVAAQSELIPISAFGLIAEPQPLEHCVLTLRENPKVRPVVRSDGFTMHWKRYLPSLPPELTGSFDSEWHDLIVQSTHRRAEAA